MAFLDILEKRDSWESTEREDMTVHRVFQALRGLTATQDHEEKEEWTVFRVSQVEMERLDPTGKEAIKEHPVYPDIREMRVVLVCLDSLGQRVREEMMVSLVYLVCLVHRDLKV